MFHAHAPSLRPHLFEHFHEPGGRQGNPILPYMAERIVPVWLRRIGCIQIENVQQPVWRNAICDAFDQIAMRVNQRESIATRQVLQCHAFKKCGLSGAGLPNEVYMGEPVLPLYAKEFSASSEIRLCQIRDVT